MQELRILDCGFWIEKQKNSFTAEAQKARRARAGSLLTREIKQSNDIQRCRDKLAQGKGHAQAQECHK